MEFMIIISLKVFNKVLMEASPLLHKKEESKQSVSRNDNYIIEETVSIKPIKQKLVKRNLVYKSVKVNCDSAKTIRPLFEQIIFENPGWKLTSSLNSDIIYLGHNTKDDDIYNILTKYKNTIINRYPNVKPLARKDTFQEMMAIANDINPSFFNFVPRTFVFPRDEAAFLSY